MKCLDKNEKSSNYDEILSLGESVDKNLPNFEVVSKFNITGNHLIKQFIKELKEY